MDYLPVDFLPVVHHVLDEHIVGRPGTVDPDLRVHHVHLDLVLLLGVGIHLLLLLHPVDAVVEHLVLCGDGTQYQPRQRADAALSRCRVGNDEDLIVEPSLQFRLMVVVVVAPGGQRAVEGGTAEQHGRIGRHPELGGQLLHRRVVAEEGLETLAVLVVLLIDGFLVHLVGGRLVDLLGVLLQHLLEDLGHIRGVLVGQRVTDVPLHMVALPDQVPDELLLQQIVPHRLVIVLHDVAHVPGQSHHEVVPLALPDIHLLYPVVDEDVDADALVADLLECLVYVQRLVFLHLADAVPHPAVQVFFLYFGNIIVSRMTACSIK